MFILPCAGEGRRLGWNGPKELFPILPGVRLIDFSLAHIRTAWTWTEVRRREYGEEWSIAVTVVSRPWKMEVPAYVAEQLLGVAVDSVEFDVNLFEWPGSVHSARARYCDVNIVLLPDSYLELSAGNPTIDADGQPLLPRILDCLNDHRVVFGYLPCRDPERLKCMGALHVTRVSGPSPGAPAGERDIVDNFRDKPDTEQHLFNGFWCCFAFTPDAGEPLHRFLCRSVNREQPAIERESFHPAGAFTVHSYLDLGTREAVHRFRLARGIDPADQIDAINSSR